MIPPAGCFFSAREGRTDHDSISTRGNIQDTTRKTANVQVDLAEEPAAGGMLQTMLVF